MGRSQRELPTVLKGLCKVIFNRIQEKIDATLRRQQAGFRVGRSCVDHIVTLRIILEQINELQESFYLVFIDYEKAFDLSTTKTCGKPSGARVFLRKSSALFNHSTGHFLSARSKKQGCILSPLLFLTVIDEILVGANDREPNRGLLWQPMEHLNDYELADDVALLAQRRSDIQGKLDDLANRSSAAGLTINVNKTNRWM